MTHRLVASADALAEALAAENAALLAMDFSRITPLAAAKAAALADFAAAQSATPPGPLPPPLRPALRGAAARLEPLAAENRRLLECAIVVQGRVLQAIAAALPRALPQQAPQYAASGAMAQAQRAVPMALSARV